MEKKFKYGDAILGSELKKGHIFTKQLKVKGREAFEFVEIEKKTGNILACSRLNGLGKKIKPEESFVFLRMEE